MPTWPAFDAGLEGASGETVLAGKIRIFTEEQQKDRGEDGGVERVENERDSAFKREAEVSG